LKSPAPPDLPQELTPLAEVPPARGFELSERLIAAQNWSSLDAAGVRMTECRLDKVVLDEAKLWRASVRDVIVNGGSWANADVADGTLRRVEFRNARLTGTSFANAAIEDVVFVDCRLDLASFRFAKLAYVRFEGCHMAEADFYEAGIKSTVYSSCSLARASLAGATFIDTELRSCDLTAIGNAERLRGVRMPWVDIVQSADVLAAGLGIEIVD
jgi:uncharacterized protein YjbI with pentapeptide repeats